MHLLKILVLMFLFLLSAPSFATKVVIIGGGLSGMRAAYDAVQIPGVDLELYEARERLGGRIFSVLLDGRAIEMGGQCIEDGGKAEELRRLANELDLKVYKNENPGTTFFYEDEKLLNITHDTLCHLPRLDQAGKEMLKVKLAALQDKYKNASLEEVLNEFFSEKVQETTTIESKRAYGVLDKFIRNRMMAYESAPVSKLAASYATGSLFEFYCKLEERHQEVNRGEPPSPILWSSIEGGNALLIEKMKEKILERGGKVHVGMPLVELEKLEDESYDLKFKNETQVHAHIVVLTVPATVYKNIKFVGHPIPQNQLNAISRIQYGPVGKFQFPMKGTFPTNGPVLLPQAGITWFNGLTGDSIRPGTVLTFYNTGDSPLLKFHVSEMDSQPEAIDTLNVFKKGTKVAYPSLDSSSTSILQPEEKQFASFDSVALGMNWDKEVYSLGGYSIIGSADADIFENTETVLGEPVYPSFSPILSSRTPGHCMDCGLFMAGEHTATEGNPATMAGAIDSGLKVGKQIRTWLGY